MATVQTERVRTACKESVLGSLMCFPRFFNRLKGADVYVFPAPVNLNPEIAAGCLSDSWLDVSALAVLVGLVGWLSCQSADRSNLYVLTYDHPLRILSIPLLSLSK